MVCPPKNTYTGLNYNLKLAEKKPKPNKAIRDELRNEMFDPISEYFHNKTLKHLKMLNYTDRYRHWYNNEAKMSLPYLKDGILVDQIYTWAKTGSVKLIDSSDWITDMNINFICSNGNDIGKPKIFNITGNDELKYRKCCQETDIDNIVAIDGCTFEPTIEYGEIIWKYNLENYDSIKKLVNKPTQESAKN